MTTMGRMTIHAIQTGSVRIKTAQVQGQGHGLRRRLGVFADPHWTEWLHLCMGHRPSGRRDPGGYGPGDSSVDSARSLHPYMRWEVMFRIEPDEELGPKLRAMGIAPRDVRRVVLTHLHVGHDGGLAHVPHSEILVSRGELRSASGWMGRVRGYLLNRWPSWFDPVVLDLAPEASIPSRRAGV